MCVWPMGGGVNLVLGNAAQSASPPPPRGCDYDCLTNVVRHDVLFSVSDTMCVLTTFGIENKDALMRGCGVHYLWFAFVCFLIRPYPVGSGPGGWMGGRVDIVDGPYAT